ncbi:helix-turn-helix domain-containing protein [Citrobacter sp. S-77]|uniref:helix-turn-helix domain-containing protein n=1 Tax=Citrobacter sp. S-77 TaxID=1080067 RepID=UPI000AD94B72
MRRFAGACRFIFNRVLALQNENHEAGNRYRQYPEGRPSQSHHDSQQKTHHDNH